MTLPTWISQRVPALGAIKAEGIRNQLGRPELDRLTVLVREAAQNSWDARDDDQDGPVRFDLELRTLDADASRAWADALAVGAPDSAHLPLLPALSERQLRVLFVSDRGTTGLGGPVRADQVTDDEDHDYVSFVLNVGDPRDTEHGGGTYGFGKAIFFLTSQASTILVYTRCRAVDGNPETRLVGCALGPSYVDGGSAYTGRHWFGVPCDDAIEPLRGAAADELASRLGFPSFGPGDFGTTVAVIAPELDGRTVAEAGRRLALSVLWHLWPKMLARDGIPSMQFRVTADGESFDVPPPTEHPVLREFVRAFETLHDEGTTVTYGSGRRPVGLLNLRTAFSPVPEVDDVGREAGLGDGIHHTCLMRVPDLVVEYRGGPPLPDPRVWYAGVFKVLPECDEAFATAEPPTHDAWLPQLLAGDDKSVVRTTLRKIEEAMRAHATPATPEERAPEASDGLARMSRKLGGLLAPASAEGAGPVTGGGGGSSSRPRALRMDGAPRWELVDGRPLLVQPFEVTASHAVTAEAALRVRVWGAGGRETEPPPGAGEPELVGWRDEEGNRHPPGPLTIPASASRRWVALVHVPEDTACEIRVREGREEGDA